MMLRRSRLLFAGLALTVIAGLCAFTPVVWNLQGRPSESYPELFALSYLLPAALVVLVGGVVQATCTRWTRGSSALFWVGIVMVLGLLAYAGLVLIIPAFPIRGELLVMTPVGGVLVIYAWLIRERA